ncbi:hypothetical protein Tco_0672885 [Tanacetum coccineum]
MVFGLSSGKCYKKDISGEQAQEKQKDSEGFINVENRKVNVNGGKRNMQQNNKEKLVEKKNESQKFIYRQKNKQEEANATKKLNQNDNHESYKTPIQSQRKIWNVDDNVIKDVRSTANKFSVLQEIEESTRLKLSKQEKEEVGKYVLMELQPSLSATRRDRRELWKDLNLNKRIVGSSTWEIMGYVNVSLNLDDHSKGMSNFTLKT